MATSDEGGTTVRRSAAHFPQFGRPSMNRKERQPLIFCQHKRETADSMGHRREHIRIDGMSGDKGVKHA